MYNLLSRNGSLQSALQSSRVSLPMKRILRLLQTVQGSVPGTDAARRVMRMQLVSMTRYFGAPLLFVTLNPADVLRPFTLKYSFDGTPQPIPGISLDASLQKALRATKLWKIVASDPAAAVEAFHLHVRTFLEVLPDVNADPQKVSLSAVSRRCVDAVFLGHCPLPLAPSNPNSEAVCVFASYCFVMVFKILELYFSASRTASMFYKNAFGSGSSPFLQRRLKVSLKCLGSTHQP